MWRQAVDICVRSVAADVAGGLFHPREERLEPGPQRGRTLMMRAFPDHQRLCSGLRQMFSGADVNDQAN